MSSSCVHISRRLVLGGMLAAGLAGRPSWVLSAPPGDVFKAVTGEVRCNGVQASPGMTVKPGDRITTGTDGEALFILGDDGFLVRPVTDMVVEDKGHDPASGQLIRDVTLSVGGVLAVFGPKVVTLKSPQVVVGVRGTAAYLESDQWTSNLCVCYGRAEMAPVGASHLTERVANRHHDNPRLITQGPKGPGMVPFMVKNHTDEELDMLESLFGRKPVFRL